MSALRFDREFESGSSTALNIMKKPIGQGLIGLLLFGIENIG